MSTSLARIAATVVAGMLIVARSTAAGPSLRTASPSPASPTRTAGPATPAVLLPDGSVVVVGGSASEGEIDSTPGCPEAHPQVVRFVPGGLP